MSGIVHLGEEDLPRVRELIDNYPFSPYRQIEGLARESLSDFLLGQLWDLVRDGCVIALQEGGRFLGVASLKELEWDSSVFGIRMGKISHVIGPVDYKESLSICRLLLTSILQISREKGIEHLSLRADTDDLALIHGVEEVGFGLMDSIVISTLDLKEWHSSEGGAGLVRGNISNRLKIRPYQERDLEELCGMTNGLFDFGRFHTDPHLPDRMCDELYLRWVKRDVQGYADTVLLSETDGVINGFVACLIDKDFSRYFKGRLGVIDLVGVSRRRQGRGVGSLLIESALEWFKERVDLVWSGTMIKNYPAIRIYQKAGFKIVGTNFSFHKWLGEEDK